MDFWRKILILAIIVLFSYILWRLLLKRKEILLEQSRQTIENFTPASNAVSISSMNVNALTTVNGITDPMTAKQLKQFVIKASYHTCYTGSDLSASMVTYALNRGYRWLDFCSADGETVCYSKDDINPESTPLPIGFGEIATQIAMHGFISPDSPNSNDPLFIQIRFLNKKTTDDNTTNLNNIINGFDEKKIPVFSGTIDKNTTIDQLLGKVVFVIDKTLISSQYSKINSILHNNDNTFMTTKPIAEASKLQAPIPLTLADNFTTTPPDKIYQFFPTGATGNSDVYSTIQVIGAQITPMCIWVNDTPLANYEAIFNNANAGIVPLSAVLKYTKKNDPNIISSSYPGAFSGK